MLATGKISIDRLIEIVRRGGAVKTGIDVFNDRGVLLLEKEAVVREVGILEKLKNAGLTRVPINAVGSGGLWDMAGNDIDLFPENSRTPPAGESPKLTIIEERIKQINEIRELAVVKYRHAKTCIKKVLDDIRHTGGEFDFKAVEAVVSELLDFLIEHENGFSFLTREIFSYDDYLYNHSINVCTIAAAALQKFNRSFSDAVNLFLGGLSFENLIYRDSPPVEAFVLFNDEEVRSITIGFFLHDVGKVVIPEHVLNKQGPLDMGEYDLVKLHSYDKGQEILEKNRIQDTFVKNIVRYHHCTMFRGEPNCYPVNLAPSQVPPYVKVCKLADMYDAMTTKRSYKEAFNPISVVTDLFRKYANKDRLLQFIVDSFVRTVGIYPAGSVVKLKNGQKAYIVDSTGPVAVPFTSRAGTPFRVMQDPLDLGEAEKRDPGFAVDRQAALASPAEEHKTLPKYLKAPIRIVARG